ncbi:MAG: TolC family protein [Planctomycetota bacterium]
MLTPGAATVKLPGMKTLHRSGNDACRYACVLIFACAYAGAGCATRVDPRADFDELSDRVRDTTGAEFIPEPTETELGPAALAAQLADGLTRAESVRLMLLYNPQARSALWSLGVARADVVQSRLWKNPELSFAVRIPDGGGLLGFDAELLQNILDFWRLPRRVRAAEAEMEVVFADAVREIVAIVFALEARYLDALGARTEHEFARLEAAAAAQLLEISRDRRVAGAATDLQLALAATRVAEAALAERRAALEVDAAMTQLVLLTGAEIDPTGIELASDWPTAPLASQAWPSSEEIMRVAIDARLELKASAAALAAAKLRVESEAAQRWPLLDAGVSIEREPRPTGERTELAIGPAVQMQLPIFDQNQAQIARAEFVLERAQAQHTGLETRVRIEATHALRRAQASCDSFRLAESELLIAHDRVTRLVREAYAAGAVSIIDTIRAEDEQRRARRAVLEARKSMALALLELERATGRPLAGRPE